MTHDFVLTKKPKSARKVVKSAKNATTKWPKSAKKCKKKCQKGRILSVSVLIPAHAERVSVSCMQAFSLNTLPNQHIRLFIVVNWR